MTWPEWDDVLAGLGLALIGGVVLLLGGML